MLGFLWDLAPNPETRSSKQSQCWKAERERGWPICLFDILPRLGGQAHYGLTDAVATWERIWTLPGFEAYEEHWGRDGACVTVITIYCTYLMVYP